MSYIRKEIYFRIIYFTFLLLLKFLHLPMMFSITTAF